MLKTSTDCKSDELLGIVWFTSSSVSSTNIMASIALHAMCGFIIAVVTSFNGVIAQKSQCRSSEFWNSDLDVCVPCTTCKQYPKTPSCNTCKSVDESPDVWKLAAITSFSVLAVVLVGAALIIGIMVHRRKSHKRPLREPIEETAGPLYQA